MKKVSHCVTMCYFWRLFTTVYLRQFDLYLKYFNQKTDPRLLNYNEKTPIHT
jgi:hypothetical protein